MILWLFVRMEDVKGLLGQFGIRAASGPVAKMNYAILIPIFAAAAVHLASLFMCISAAKGASRQKVLRPTPPVDKPF